jgi:hypothetical protein
VAPANKGSPAEKKASDINPKNTIRFINQILAGFASIAELKLAFARLIAGALFVVQWQQLGGQLGFPESRK